MFLQRLGLVAISGLVIPALAACGGQQAAQSAVGVTPPMQSDLNARSFAHESNSHARPTTSECPCLYVANENNPGSVEVYPANSKGDVKPIQDITGYYTGLVDPNRNRRYLKPGGSTSPTKATHPPSTFTLPARTVTNCRPRRSAVITRNSISRRGLWSIRSTVISTLPTRTVAE